MLIQEFVNLLSSPDPSIDRILGAMHIHPALSEVVQQACSTLMTPEDYHQVLPGP